MLGLGRCMPPMPQRIMGNKLSMIFDGVNDNGIVAFHETLRPATDARGIAFNFWYNKDKNATPGTVIQVSDTEENYWIKVSLNSSSKLQLDFDVPVGGYTTLDGTAIDYGVWYNVHVQIGYIDGNNWSGELYINGSKANNGPVSVPATNWTQGTAFSRIVFGAELDGSSGWGETFQSHHTCLIGDTCFFNSYLPETAIKQIYYAQNQFNFNTNTNYYLGSNFVTALYLPESMTGTVPNVTVPDKKNPDEGGNAIRLQNGAKSSSDTPST